jgi:16S rRNA (cytidine1402-2'-O)-methyltransferase
MVVALINIIGLNLSKKQPMPAIVYLIPTTLGDTTIDAVIPQQVKDVVLNTKYFIVEEVRTARRFISKMKLGIQIDSLTFYELNEHTKPAEVRAMLQPALDGHDMGIISEAGVPGVADPGADAVAEAHRMGVKVVPLVGPSSILMSLMASGLNGQNFAFVGYLPVKPAERGKAIKALEQRSFKERQTQIFIETPYRNNHVLKDIIDTCNPETRLCVATDITTATEFIVTKKVGDWRKQVPDLHKRPTVFLILA